MIDCPDREDDVRLRGVEMVEEVREGMEVVFEVEVVDVEGVRREVWATLL